MAVALAGTPSVDAKSVASLTHTVTKPAGVVAGDLLLLQIAADATTAITENTTTDWTLDRSSFSTPTRLNTFFRIATGTEPASWNFDLGVSTKSGSICTRITGANTSTPRDATTTGSVGSSTTITSPAITTVTDAALILVCATCQADTATTIAVFTAMTEVAQGAGRRVAMDSATQATAGTFGAQTASIGATPLIWLANTVAIRPAVVAAGGGAPTGNLPLATDRALRITNDATNAAYARGFLRRPTDGSLVGTTSTVGSTMVHGYLRAANGALVYNVGGTPAVTHNGFAFASDGSLCTVGTDPAPAWLRRGGLKFDSSGRVYATVLA